MDCSVFRATANTPSDVTARVSKTAGGPVTATRRYGGYRAVTAVTAKNRDKFTFEIFEIKTAV